MKKETIEKGNNILKYQNEVQDKIEIIVNGRAVHGRTSAQYLDQISLITKCPEQSNRSTYFNFNTVGDNVGQLKEYYYLSQEARSAISFQAYMFYEAISAILLKEEKRLQLEFDNLKD